MQKTYIVRLSDEEREICLAVIKKLKGPSGKVRRAHILLQADADGPNWKAQVIAQRLSDPPEGRNGWTLRLFAEKVVERQIVDSISPQTIQRTLEI